MRVDVTCQADWDALPSAFDQETFVRVSGVDIQITETPVDARVYCADRARVRVTGDCIVFAENGSRVHVYSNARVNAYSGAAVRAYGESTVHAWGGATVQAFDSAVVRAFDVAMIEAWHNSRVVSTDRATVVAYGDSEVHSQGDSMVHAFGNATVHAWDRSVVSVHSCRRVVARMLATVVVHAVSDDVELHEQAVLVDRSASAQWTRELFVERFRENLCTDGRMLLYKSVNPDNNMDFYSQSITYQGTVTCPDWDPNPERSCGGGLHLCPTPELTQEFNIGKVLKCVVDVDDIAVYPFDITKVRCRRVRVIEEV